MSVIIALPGEFVGELKHRELASYPARYKSGWAHFFPECRIVSRKGLSPL